MWFYLPMKIFSVHTSLKFTRAVILVWAQKGFCHRRQFGTHTPHPCRFEKYQPSTDDSVPKEGGKFEVSVWIWPSHKLHFLVAGGGGEPVYGHRSVTCADTFANRQIFFQVFCCVYIQMKTSQHRWTQSPTHLREVAILSHSNFRKRRFSIFPMWVNSQQHQMFFLKGHKCANMMNVKTTSELDLPRLLKTIRVKTQLNHTHTNPAHTSSQNSNQHKQMKQECYA